MVDYSKIRLTGPFQDYKEMLWDELMSLKYKPFSACNLMRLTAQFSRWLLSKGIHLEGLKLEHVDKFLMSRRRSGHRHFVTRRALYPTLNCLAVQ